MSTATASTPGPSLVPSNDLTITSTAPPPPGTNPPPSRFVLFTTEWLDLQNYIQMALALPVNQGDFATKYGDFAATDTQLITGALAAMTNVKNLSADFGDPASLKAKIIGNPAYLTMMTPPQEIYGHIVWLANQIQNAASTYSYTFANLSAIIGPTAGDQATRAANLKLILNGPGGLASTAADMQTKVAALLTKLLTFDGKISSANTDILAYVASGSSLLATANKMIGTLNDDITNNLQPAADKAYKAWRDYTIAAITTSIGIMILSAGILWPVAVGLGVGLGVAAATQKAKYNALMDQIAQDQVDIRKKTRLVTDLTGLNDKVAIVAPAISSFRTSLQQVEGVWNNASMNLAYIANNYSDAQLADYNWVMQAMKIGDAQTKWQAIAATTQEYTSNSLVSYDFSTTFGQKIA